MAQMYPVNFIADVVTGTVPLSVVFTDLNPMYTLYARVWDYGDGTVENYIARQPTVTHVYAVAGIYTVSMRIVGHPAGPSYEYAIKANYITAGLLIPHRIKFTNTTLYADSYLWDFGDESTSTEENPVHDYVTNGPFTVILTATNAGGFNTDTQTLDFTPVVTADFSWQQVFVTPA